jgi:hypothetical protein
MTGEDTGGVGESDNVVDGCPQRLGAATGKIGARRAAIRHEERVVDEGSIADHVGDRGKRMSRREQNARVERADLDAVAVGEQTVPLRAVGA